MSATAEEAVIRVDPALPCHAVAAAIGDSKIQFWRRRRAKRFPPPDLFIPSLRPDGEPRPRWYASTVNRWLAEQPRTR